VCGDGYQAGDEECDEGDSESGDGCSSTCEVECGYTCTGGSPTTADECTSSCGDGYLASDEACDDGNTVNDDGCSSDCTVLASLEDGWDCTLVPCGPTTCEEVCGDGTFFNASVVQYPSSSSYTGAYETRSLTPVAGYAHGTSMFTTLDISHVIMDRSGGRYAGGVLGANGLIYFVPYYTHNVGILDPAFTTLDISQVISSGGPPKFAGGVLGANGLIYFVPNGVDNIGILDPAFPSFTTLDISQVSSGTGGKYVGGVLGPNGLIYFVPGDANNIGILDPSSSSFTTLDISQVISSGRYNGGVLGPNGLISLSLTVQTTLAYLTLPFHPLPLWTSPKSLLVQVASTVEEFWGPTASFTLSLAMRTTLAYLTRLLHPLPLWTSPKSSLLAF